MDLGLCAGLYCFSSPFNFEAHVPENDSFPMQVYLKAGLFFCCLGLAACSGGGASVAPGQLEPTSSQNSIVANPASQAQATTSSLPSSAAADVSHTASTVSTAASATSEIAINPGGSGTGSWVTDTDYSGGYATAVSNTIGTSGVSNPAPQAVYQSQRTGATITYAVPSLTANSAYTLRLHFVESWFNSSGKRQFNVTINGAQVLSNFDIFAAAGGKNVAVVKQFTANADSSGAIKIVLTATVNNASIAGIEVIGAGVSAPAPTAAPTGAPSSRGSGSGGWPSAGWSPYQSGPLTAQVGSNPSYISNSASIVNTLWGGRSSDAGLLQVYAGSPPPSSNDWSADVLYFGHAGDPQYTINCFDYGGGCAASGVKVHIPRGAYPEGGSDHHIDIRDTVTGQDVMLWNAPVPNGSGGTYSVGWGTVVNSNSQGIDAVGSTASGISALWAIRETDLANNSINHAIVVSINGESSQGYVYPAVGNDKQYFRSNYPEMGAHFWLDVAPSQLPSNCPAYAVSYLTALHKYGAYFVDYGNVSSVFGVAAESDMSYTYNGGASVWGPFMSSLGQNSSGASNLMIDNCGINMQMHMHILTPP